jgi:hypothetical protein
MKPGVIVADNGWRRRIQKSCDPSETGERRVAEELDSEAHPKIVFLQRSQQAKKSRIREIKKAQSAAGCPA